MSKSQSLIRFRKPSWRTWARNINFRTISSSPFSKSLMSTRTRNMRKHIKFNKLEVNSTGRVASGREARNRCLRCLPTWTTARPATLCFRRSSGSNLSSNYRRRFRWTWLRKIGQRCWNRTSEVGLKSLSSQLTSTSSRGSSERKLTKSSLIYRKSPILLS